MKPVDEEFNKLYFNEIFPLISKSFLLLSSKLCDNRLNGFDSRGELEEAIKEKANQVKEKMNNYIDLQVEQSLKVFKG